LIPGDGLDALQKKPKREETLNFNFAPVNEFDEQELSQVSYRGTKKDDMEIFLAIQFPLGGQISSRNPITHSAFFT
jgi:hypothetical protein